MPIVSDVGTVFEVTIESSGTVVDLSSATTLELKLIRPDETSVTRSGTLATDGTDGRVDFTVQSGDFSQVGLYKLQARVITASGEWRSTLDSIFVNKKL